MTRSILFFLSAMAVHAAVADTTVFINVNVIPMTSEAVVGAQTVIVKDGIIETIGDVEAVPVPEEAIVVDGTDRYLMPGLAEMHAHVPAAGSADLDR